MPGPSAFTLRRRDLLVLACGVAGAGARAQAWPDKPIRLTLGYPPGGGTDFVARMVAARLSQVLKQQVVVANLPGATGAIALDRVVHSAPDGYNLILVSAADTILPALRKLSFDIQRDLVPVAPVVTGALGLVVHPSLPARDVKELIALAKAKPGQLNYGSPGVGNSQHLAGEFFNKLAGVRMVHVPFKGGAEAINSAVAGETQVAFASLAPVMALVDAGKLRLLAVTTGKRSAAVPNTPTIAEAGVPGYDRATWFGVAAPAGVPRDVVQRLNAALTAAMEGAEVRDTLLKQGLEPMQASVEQFGAFVHGELAQNAAIVRSMGITAE